VTRLEHIREANEAAAVVVLAERGALAALISHALVDASAGEELAPHHEMVPGHDLDVVFDR